MHTSANERGQKKRFLQFHQTDKRLTIVNVCVLYRLTNHFTVGCTLDKVTIITQVVHL